jgi:hypothetical protein
MEKRGFVITIVLVLLFVSIVPYLDEMVSGKAIKVVRFNGPGVNTQLVGPMKVLCIPGKTKLCPLQEGVCAGAKEMCTMQGIWEGCDGDEYGPKWEDSFELTCNDGLDNDCDIVYDDKINNPVNPDPDCQGSPGCKITNAYWDIT